MCRLGIKGAAIATSIGQCIGCLIPLIFFFFDNNGTNLHFVFTCLQIKPIAKACLNGLSEMMIIISVSVVTMLYNFQLLRIKGSDGVIVYGVIAYCSYIFNNAFTGYCDGSAPIVSFHFGAKNEDELKNLLKRGLVIIFVFSLFIVGTAEGLSSVLAMIFVRDNDELFKLTTRAVRIYSISFIITGYNIFASSFFTGLNNGIVSAIISTSRTLVCEVVMIFVLPLIFDIDGIWMAVSFAEIITLIISLYFFITNRMKYNYY